MATIAKIKLNDGREMPQVGFGLWKVAAESAAEVVYNAIKAGYRLFDGAFDYGNEKECGEGIKRALSEGLVKREELFIVSKLWNTFHEKHRVEPICRKQLEWWGVDYFDLFLMHFPVSLEYVPPEISYPSGWTTPNGAVVESKVPIHETWPAMESLVDAGLTKSIGISNFCGGLIVDLMRYSRIPPAVLQIEHHPYLVQSDLLTLAKARNIAVTAYSSFGPQSFLELSKTATSTLPLFENPVVVDMAKKYNKSPAQILLRWSTQRGLAVIPKSNSFQRQLENFEVTGFDMEQGDLDKISKLDKGLRFNDPASFSETLHIFA